MTRLATSAKPVQMFEYIIGHHRVSTIMPISALMKYQREYLFYHKHADGQAADVYGIALGKVSVFTVISIK